MLRALTACGLLCRRDDRFVNGQEAAIFLDSRSPSCVGEWLQRSMWTFSPIIDSMRELVKSGPPPQRPDRHMNSEAMCELYTHLPRPDRARRHRAEDRRPGDVAAGVRRARADAGPRRRPRAEQRGDPPRAPLLDQRGLRSGERGEHRARLHRAFRYGRENRDDGRGLRARRLGRRV